MLTSNVLLYKSPSNSIFKSFLNSLNCLVVSFISKASSFTAISKAGPPVSLCSSNEVSNLPNVLDFLAKPNTLKSIWPCFWPDDCIHWFILTLGLFTGSYLDIISAKPLFLAFSPITNSDAKFSNSKSSVFTDIVCLNFFLTKFSQ